MEFRNLCRKYKDHGFLVSGREVLDGYICLLIQANGRTREEVGEFAGECLGKGCLGWSPREDGSWPYFVEK